MSLDFQFLNDFPLPLCVQHVIHRQFVERDRMTACSTAYCLSNTLLHTSLLNAINMQVYVAITHYYEREICGMYCSEYEHISSGIRHCAVWCVLTFQRNLPSPTSEEMNVRVVRGEFYRFPRQNAINLKPPPYRYECQPVSRVYYQQQTYQHGGHDKETNIKFVQYGNPTFCGSI